MKEANDAVVVLFATLIEVILKQYTHAQSFSFCDVHVLDIIPLIQ